MAGTRSPFLLEQYLALPPEGSLIVLSGIVGASTNWLALRYVAGLLGPQGGSRRPDPASGIVEERQNGWDGEEQDTAVLLGADLPGLAKKGRFGFVDGLTSLFYAPDPQQPPLPPPTAGTRRLVWDWQPRPGGGMKGVAATLHAAVDDLLLVGGARDRPLRRRVVLVVDQPDLLLAAAGPEASVPELRNLLLDLREKVHACIVTLSADEPLVSTQTTTLEREHASLLLSLAHEARMVLSLRLLDTGAANDVSGVVRITRGGAHVEEDPGVGVEEHEYLYHVGGDGGVRVFERGGH